MQTMNAAYASFDESRKGSLEVGKLADLVVTSEDIAQVPVTVLRDLPVDMTMVDGRVVYERS